MRAASATSIQYRTRSSFVTGPSGASGKYTFCGFVTRISRPRDVEGLGWRRHPDHRTRVGRLGPHGSVAWPP